MLRSLLKLMLMTTGTYDSFRHSVRKRMFPKYSPYDAQTQRELILRPDPVRDHSIVMTLLTIQRDNIAGSFAERGLYRGQTSELIHNTCPDRKLYLFDTFEGISETLREGDDDRFDNTSEEYIISRLGNSQNVIIRKGFFPDTSRGLENEAFSFVMLDADIYEITLSGLDFFYPRAVPRGYIFAHDFNNPESNHGVSKAFKEFFHNKPEHCIEITDIYGSVVFRKI
ncbi:TylF/MycF/NovP-related O-methyltransferase [Candidatus Latescibacterota bacterium]